MPTLTEVNEQAILSFVNRLSVKTNDDIRLKYWIVKGSKIKNGINYEAQLFRIIGKEKIQNTITQTLMNALPSYIRQQLVICA